MGKRLDLTGQKFGRLTVIKLIRINKHRKPVWLCQCKCGNKTEVAGTNLKSGNTQSCGCLYEDIAITHGMCGTATYDSWASMKNRCNNPNDPSYKNYGGRGIKVCERWQKFENFFEDMGVKPKKLTIERTDNDGNYGPENCTYATRQEQSRNSRNTKLDPLKVQVIKKLLAESQLKQAEIADIFKVGESTIWSIKKSKTWKDVVYDSPCA